MRRCWSTIATIVPVQMKLEKKRKCYRITLDFIIKFNAITILTNKNVDVWSSGEADLENPGIFPTAPVMHE